jgi:SAM-dependent methyltransferase
MRTFRHWNPRYFKNRLALYFYEWAYASNPWLTPAANKILESILTQNDIGLEFGSGKSTVWFAKRLKHLTSVEHNKNWFAKVQRLLDFYKIKNVELKLIQIENPEGQSMQSEYLKAVIDIVHSSLDFCLVDGIYRDFCVLNVIEKIKPGGVLVIDNINWYLPSNSVSPNSRTESNGAMGEIWKEIGIKLSKWRCIWTTSGVTDTAIFIKPCKEV